MRASTMIAQSQLEKMYRPRTLRRGAFTRFAEPEDELEPSAGDVVQGVGQQTRVLRIACEVEMELSRRRKLERERVAAQIRGMRLAQERRGRDAAAFLDCRQDGAGPRLL